MQKLHQRRHEVQLLFSDSADHNNQFQKNQEVLLQDGGNELHVMFLQSLEQCFQKIDNIHAECCNRSQTTSYNRLNLTSRTLFSFKPKYFNKPTLLHLYLSYSYRQRQKLRKTLDYCIVSIRKPCQFNETSFLIRLANLSKRSISPAYVFSATRL